MADWFFDEYEPEYGDPTCPKCGNPATETAECDEPDPDTHTIDGMDYHCHNCLYAFDSDDAFSDEPIGHKIDDGEYLAVDCLDSDVMIIKSPYYTYAPFCSPCVPGAGNLDDAIPANAGCKVFGCPEPFNRNEHEHKDRYGVGGFGHRHADYGVKTYCFGHDWFEGGKAPYRVFRVADDTEVQS